MSQHVTFSLPADVTQVYIVCRGDLAVQGEVRDNIRVTYDKEDGQPRLEPTDAGAGVELTIDGDGGVQLPNTVNLVVSNVDGDLAINHLQADVSSANVHGDAAFNTCSHVSLDNVHGDAAFNHVTIVQARNIHGDSALSHVERGRINAVHGDMAANHCIALTVDTVNGDCALNHIESELQITTVRGDAVINNIHGDISFEEIDGDVVFRGTVASGDAVRLRAWGTVTMNLDGPARVHRMVGGGEWDTLPGWDEIRAQPATGDELDGAEVLVAAGDDLIFSGMSMPHAFSLFEKMPHRRNAPMPPHFEFDESMSAGTQTGDSAKQSAGEDETMMVLKMIQEGKITPEEGDMLLDALSK